MSKPVIRWSSRAQTRRRNERGDVPGWVLITVMGAGLVAGLWAIAGSQLGAMLREAAIAQWASEKGIRVESSGPDLTARLKGLDFDHLASIVRARQGIAATRDARDRRLGSLSRRRGLAEPAAVAPAGACRLEHDRHVDPGAAGRHCPRAAITLRYVVIT